MAFKKHMQFSAGQTLVRLPFDASGMQCALCRNEQLETVKGYDLQQEQQKRY